MGHQHLEQVAGMLGNLVKFQETPKYLDATDGLAAAVCHYFQGGKVQGSSNYSGWKSFLKDNPDRMK